MPCRYDPSPEEIRRNQEELDTMARLACDFCTMIEKGEIEGLGDVPEWARKWWEAHKVADARRREADRKAAIRQKEKDDALAKLTPAERKVLGL